MRRFFITIATIFRFFTLDIMEKEPAPRKKTDERLSDQSLVTAA